MVQILYHDPVLAETLVLGGSETGITIHKDGPLGWRLAGSTRLPYSWASAFDVVRGAVMVVTLDGATVEWDGQSWRALAPPDARLASNPVFMAYDEGRRRMVARVERLESGTPRARTYEWDGAAWTASSVEVSDASGNPRALGYDIARGVVVMHQVDLGGQVKTWEYDGVGWRTAYAGPGPSLLGTLTTDLSSGRAFGIVAGDREYFWTGAGWEAGAAWPATAGLRSLAPAPTPGRVLGITFNGMLTECTPTTASLRSRPEPARTQGIGVYDTVRGEARLVSSLTYNLPALHRWDGAGWTVDESWGYTQIYGGTMTDTPDGASFGLYEMGDNGTSRCSEWTAAGWRGRNLRYGPTDARFRSNMIATDLARGEVISFGGDTGQATNRMWALRPGEDWRTIVPSGTWPAARRDATGAYDTLNQRVLMFGGGPAGGFFDQLWSWNGASWTLLSTGTGPSARSLSALAFDSARGVLVLYGGRNQVNRSDTWEWNGAWRQVVTPHTPPTGPQRMAYDAARGVCVMAAAGAAGVDLWEYDGADWTRRWTGSVPRRSGGIVFDPASRRVVISGDDSSTAAVGQSWAWDGAGWTRLTAETPDADGAAVAFDAGRGRLVLFGGVVHAGAAITSLNPTNALWEHDGERWLLRGASGPSPRTSSAMAYDPDAGRTLLFGGQDGTGALGDTWSWDGSAWTLAAVGGPARYNATLVYDPVRGRFVLVGGRTPDITMLNEAWEFDGASWTRLPDPPDYALTSESYRAGLFFDPVGGHVVIGDRDLTCRWSGGAWEREFGSVQSQMRALVAAVFDVGRGQALRFYMIGSGEYRTTILQPAALVVERDPSPLVVTLGGDAEFDALARSAAPMEARWEKDGVPLVDDGRVSGSRSPKLRISAATAADAGFYRMVAADGCATVATRAASLTVECPADFNGDGFLDFFDYDGFAACFEMGVCPSGASADFNADGFVDFFDYDDFVGAFESGC